METNGYVTYSIISLAPNYHRNVTLCSGLLNPDTDADIREFVAVFYNSKRLRRSRWVRFARSRDSNPEEG